MSTDPGAQPLKKILVIRRDNIGDLVCTTPLVTALRGRFPDAWIGAWVNSYNAPVLSGFEGLDEVFVYTKLKHLEPGQSALSAIATKLDSFARLRRMQLDCALIATTHFSARTLRLARWLGPRTVAGLSDGSEAARGLDLALPAASVEGRHEVERVFELGKLFGIDGPIPALRLAAPREQRRVAEKTFGPGEGPRIAVHISARRPAQRWPSERFAELIRGLHAAHGARCMLLWAPGAEAAATHPGDDEKAAEVIERVGGAAPLVPFRTERLEDLTGALEACDAVICPDGGAMHLAAGLGKPVVALFGDSPAERWRPWGVPCRVLQPASRNVNDIEVAQVLEAFASLLAEALK